MAGPIGTGPFGGIQYNPTLKRDFRVAINSQPWVTGSPRLVISNYLAATKFLGYAALNPSATALVASKFLGFAVLNPSATALVASKFLGYAVLSPSPLALAQTDKMWPNPRGYIFPQHLRGFTQSSPVNLGIPVLAPRTDNYDWPNPRGAPRLRLDFQQGNNPNLVPASGPPLSQLDWPNPQSRRQPNLGFIQPTIFGAGFGFISPFFQLFTG